jgi:hypothetical protein
MTLLYGLLAFSLLLSAGAAAQTFTDQGLLSGSGMSILPTATIVPPTEFRVQLSRVDYLGSAKQGMNVFGMGVGLSTAIEGYVRVTGEQLGFNQSQIVYGFGGKIRVPLLLPVVRRAAIWAERTTSDMALPSNIYTPDALRAGVIVTADSNGIHPTFLVGMTRIGELTRPLVGAGVTIAAGNTSQVSLELVHGYLGRKSFMAAGTFSHRPFRNIAFHATPGYLTTPTASSWTISLGFSLATADIDFHPVYDVEPTDEFILPSIEELERGTAFGAPGMLDSTNADATQSSTLPGTMQEDGAVQQNLPVDGPAIDAPLMDGPALDAPVLDGRPEGELQREEEHHEE